MLEDLKTRSIVSFMELTGRKLAKSILKWQDVTDAVHVATIKGQAKRNSFKGETPEERAAWLKRILRNTCFDFRHQRKGRREELLKPSVAEKLAVDEDAVGLALAAESHAASKRRAKILSADIEAALSALPSSQREIVELHLKQEMTTSKIAAHLELGLGSVRGRLSRGLQDLRRQLEIYNTSRFPENLERPDTDPEQS